MPTPTPPALETEFGSRLLVLADGRPGLRGSLHITATEPPATEPATSNLQPATPPAVLDFIASDNTLDRYDEVIEASGWNLTNYRRNPVFQNSHKYGDVIFTLGKALITEVRGTALFQRIQFAVDVNPMAKIAYGLYKAGCLSAVSVGFIPIRWEQGTQDAPYRRKYLEQELLELSAVAVPANPNALVMGLKSGALVKADLEDALALVRSLASAMSDQSDQSDASSSLAGLLATGKHFCSSQATLPTHAGAPGAESHGAQLLQLARTLNTVLLGA